MEKEVLELVARFRKLDTTSISDAMDKLGIQGGLLGIKAVNRGNGYVSYYSDDYTNAPKIKLHFAMATETGYFDASRHNNDDWVRLLANAKSDIFDILTLSLIHI